MDLNYHSMESLLKAAKENSCRLSALVLEQQAEQMELPKQEIYEKMRENYRVMASCIQPGSAPDLKSTSGLTGGDAYRMRTAVEQGKNLTGPLLGGALYRALAVSELNASMGRIVAAPTAGSCGIVPAAVLTMQEQYQLTEEECVMSLFTASAVGMVIANNASLAGAQGGCQAECGSAAAMAAAWHAELSPRGVTVRVLRQCPRTGAVLVYVYRPARVARLLAAPHMLDFLAGEGYTPGTADELLDQLAERLCCEGDFPHEIGVFLGYPLADVIGFIQNRGKNFTACGYWKVYTDPTAAQAEFDRYKKCERIYARCYYNGTPIRRLTVAA